MGKHVVHLVQGLSVGGLELMVVRLATEMVCRGHGVTICCYDREGELVPLARKAGIGVELVPRKPGLDAGYIRRLAVWLKRKAPDVLHMHNSTAFFYGTLAGRLAGVPCLIFTEHDGVFPRRRLLRLANRILLRRVTHAVAVSEAVRELWCRHDGLDPARVKVVANGVPDTFPKQAPRHHQGGSLRIGSVGRLSHEKGMDVLVEAFAEVRAKQPGAELALVGDGIERPALAQRVAELALDGSVHLLGTRHDVPDLLAGFDIFVLPSRSEGLPLAVLEAMAARLPIVATRVGGIPEAITDGETGLLVPAECASALAAAILRLAEDAGLRESFGCAARRRFEQRYTLQTMVDTYERLMRG